MQPFLSDEQKKHFPLLQSGLVYLDNAATTLTPKPVVDAMNDYYLNFRANIHRGVYDISEKATRVFEEARDTVQKFIGANHREEIIFTSGTTASLNTIARFVGQHIKAGDEIILTLLEHHSNLIPWQLLAKEKGCSLKFLSLHEQGEIDPEELRALITPRTRVLACAHVSNASGYLLPLKELIRIAKEHGLITVVDAAQSIPHMPVNVQELNVDFLAFSGHKLCGPTGVGVLYAKREVLQKLEPVWGGGGMIQEVELTSATWADLPYAFEAGTPPIAEVIGLGAAIRYIQTLGLQQIYEYEEKLLAKLIAALQHIDGVHVFGPLDTSRQQSIVSFAIEQIHPHDLASVLNEDNIAVRAGHHCAQPLMKAWNVLATTRASLYFYNTVSDVEKLITGIQRAQTVFA